MVRPGHFGPDKPHNQKGHYYEYTETWEYILHHFKLRS